jgi:dihydropyrimidine dehydrogenase (NAD+) subunit PreA
MADLSCNFLGIQSPNPFWLASASPTDKKYNVLRAFEAGWGGVVWKTLGSQVKNVSSRYSAVNFNGTRMMGFNNIELISDRPLHINLKEITECVKLFPDRAMIVSLMADNNRSSWHELIQQCEDAGAAVGQDPDIARMVVEWVMEKATIPVITKLTPNVHSVVPTGKAVVEAGTNALSLINTIQSVTGVDLDTLVPNPYVAGKSVYGGYCGPAVKPIALKMLTSIAQNPVTARVPISGIGGVSNWKDAAEFMLLGASNVQVCTAAMKYGFRIIEDMCEGLSNWMDEKGFATVNDFIGKSVPTITHWEDLDINYHHIAKINQDKCIHCGLCYIACEDTSHQSISLTQGNPYNTYTIKEDDCVGCNLCQLVCPVNGCITMEEARVAPEYLNWIEFQKRGLPLNDH